MPVEVKELGDRQLEIAGSTEDVDRMGDVIKANGWQLAPFKKNPVFMWAHDYSQPPIGRATKVWIDKESKRLMFNIEFADKETYEFADTIYKLYKGGFLHATSVGFIPLDWEGKTEEEPNPKWEGNIYKKQELLELSAVPVPANAEALVNARESGLITVKEFNAMTKEVEVKAEYTCECIDCGHKMETDEHCKDIKCPKCGGTMRRAERPGAGEESIKLMLSEGEAEPTALATQEKPEVKTITQEQLSDDLDYVTDCIEEVGLSPVAMEMAFNVMREILRSAGNDIPVDILTKVGAVLNAKNKGRLTQIQELAQSVLDSAATPDEGDKQLEPPTPTKAELLKERALEVAEVANIVIAQLQGKRIY